MATLFKRFLGGPIGSGRQGLSWIHRDDWVEAVRFIINDPRAVMKTGRVDNAKRLAGLPGVVTAKTVPVAGLWCGDATWTTCWPAAPTSAAS